MEENNNNITNSLKLIIADRGPGSIGKTTSIRKVFNILQSKHPSTTIVHEPVGTIVFPLTSGDVNATIQIGGTLIGIESQGDPGCRMPKSIDDFIAKGCEIILVACRNQGATINKVIDLEKHNGYTVLWLQNGKCPNYPACWDKLTDQYSVWVADIIEKCALTRTLSPTYL